MSCNPCCCWKLKDAAMTVGMWSMIYALASLAMFTWQWGVLSQCQHVTMAQSNLQCEYYCPCIGASTARTSIIVEALFVIQILCLIASFFLLFTSVMLMYGIHVWSRYLVYPWFITMTGSILTSLAYCVTWWAGDVRDYWLVLTILEAFGVFLNCYCVVVIFAFYRRMGIELKYYEGRRAQKYNRFNPREMSQNSEQDFIDDDGYPCEMNAGYLKFPPADPLPPYYPPAPTPNVPRGYSPAEYRPSSLPQKFEPSGINDQSNQHIEPLNLNCGSPRSTMPKVQSVPSLFDDFKDVPRQEHRRSQRHRTCHCDSRSCRRKHTSAHHAHKSRQRHHFHRGSCCGGHGDDCRRRSKSRHRHHCRREKDMGVDDLPDSCCSSEFCSTVDFSGTDSVNSSRYYHNIATLERRRKENLCRPTRNLSRVSDANESEEYIENVDVRKTLPKSSMRRHKSVPSDVRKSRHTERMMPKDNLSDRQAAVSNPFNTLFGGSADAAGTGISIPQHIVIPPSSDNTDGERKYQINSEITIFYDPKLQRFVTNEPRGSSRSTNAPILPPRTPQV